MRILTWNLAGGKKGEICRGLEADLALFQERRRFDADEAGEHWVGARHFKGLSVSTRDGWSLRRIDGEFPPYFVPYQVSGREAFQLIHVWAGPDDKYVRGTVRAVELWADAIRAQPTVIAGDFNASAIWDREHPADRNFSALARRLEELGLVSAYHTFYGEAFGAESRPTFFLQRNEGKPYHLDYCFIPRAWLPRLTFVNVGAFGEWARFSDHMPVIVELG